MEEDIRLQCGSVSFHSSGGVYGEFVSDPDSGLLGELFFLGLCYKSDCCKQRLSRKGLVLLGISLWNLRHGYRTH